MQARIIHGLKKEYLRSPYLFFMKKYYVYILKCNDDSYYTGITNNVLVRFSQHESGYDPKAYTFRRRPLELVFTREFDKPLAAIAFEKQVKRWSRKKKEALINGKDQQLNYFARCRNLSTSTLLKGRNK
jgi:putative endonuclease